MPTWVANTDAVVSFDNDGGTLTDMSDYVSQVNLSVANTVTGFYTFGLAAEQNSEGKQSWTGSVGIRPATDTGGAHEEMIDWLTPSSGSPGARTLRIQEPDGTAGSFQWDMEIYVSDYNVVSQDADGDGSPTVRTANFRVDGAPTLTIIT